MEQNLPQTERLSAEQTKEPPQEQVGYKHVSSELDGVTMTHRENHQQVPLGHKVVAKQAGFLYRNSNNPNKIPQKDSMRRRHGVDGTLGNSLETSTSESTVTLKTIETCSKSRVHAIDGKNVENYHSAGKSGDLSNNDVPSTLSTYQHLSDAITINETMDHSPIMGVVVDAEGGNCVSIDAESHLPADHLSAIDNQTLADHCDLSTTENSMSLRSDQWSLSNASSPPRANHWAVNSGDHWAFTGASTKQTAGSYRNVHETDGSVYSVVSSRESMNDKMVSKCTMFNEIY